MERCDEILQYWFEGLDQSAAIDRNHPCYYRWFSGKPEIDADIVQKFKLDVEAARAGRCDVWGSTPRGSLALVLVLDQFPRHIFRGDRRAFDSDAKALAISKDCVRTRLDESLPLFERLFLYLPLQHSEHLPDHDIAYERFSNLAKIAKEHSAQVEHFFEMGLKNQVEHMDAIQRFGRYPYRNEALGRQSTPEELEYLNALKRSA